MSAVKARLAAKLAQHAATKTASANAPCEAAKPCSGFARPKINDVINAAAALGRKRVSNSKGGLALLLDMPDTPENTGLRLDEVLNNLAGFGVMHVLVECGPTLARSFFEQSHLLDRVWLIRSPVRSTDSDALPGPNMPNSFQQTG